MRPRYATFGHFAPSMTAVGMPSGYFADDPSKAVSRKVSAPTEPRAHRIWFVVYIEDAASTGRVGEERVPEDKPSSKDLAPKAAGIPAEGENGKDVRSDGLPIVLAVYATSRIFYLVAGSLLAGYLPAGGFY